MALSHLQLIALGLIKGFGMQTVFKISKYVEDNNIHIDTENEMLNILVDIKERKIIKRFPSVIMEDIEDGFISAHNIISRSEQEGIGIISYYDSEYPEILRSTIDEDGKLSAPVVLYYKGDIKVASLPGIAVIGTREPTNEGVKGGKYLASEFAKRGFNIISGLAIGCDTCGHKGALEVGGKTTAFLAHGLDTVYPKQNKELVEEILKNGGLLLSEYPIGTSLNKYYLVARDRLQAGLSFATLVIQTGVSGGTMHAANTTLKAGKQLYAIWYKTEHTRNEEKVLGNDFLVGKGASYIKGDSNIDEIAEKIKEWKKSETNLF